MRPDTLEQQQEMFFEPPSKIAKGVPKRLEQLIVRLLSFEPAARLSRANEVIKEINKFTRLRFKLETDKTLEAYLLSSRFVGREKEMALVKFPISENLSDINTPCCCLPSICSSSRKDPYQVPARIMGIFR